MYVIAICDDEKTELAQTEKMIKDYEKKYPEYELKLDKFENTEKLLRMVRENGYEPDLLILDIIMPGKTGIEAARELRAMGIESRIIFFTSSKEYALDAYAVDAIQYLVKPVSEQKLFLILDKILKDIEESKKTYALFRIGGKTCRVLVHDIVYLEAQGKSQHMYLSDGTQILLHRSIAELYGMLCSYPEFVKVGAAYIVNLRYLESLNAHEMKMESGDVIYLPRGSYQELREKYFEYYCEEE